VKKNANYLTQKYNASVIQYMEPSHMLRTNDKMHHEETDHGDFSMTAMSGSFEYGNASLGLITNRYISDYLKRFKKLMENLV
jgi:hypothetical protein